MRIQISAAVALALAGGFCGMQPAAHAADTANLSVTGTIITSACTPTIDHPVLDLGDVRYGDLNVDTPTNLDQKDFTLFIRCPTPLNVAFRVMDNTATGAGTDISLGTVPGGTQQIGDASISPQMNNEGDIYGNPTVDGMRSVLTWSNDTGEHWLDNNQSYIRLEPEYMYAAAADESADPTAGGGVCLSPATATTDLWGRATELDGGRPVNRICDLLPGLSVRPAPPEQASCS
jgi:type 1 fimbria pilin